MKTVKLIGIGAGALLAAAIIAGSVFLWKLSHRAVPDYNSSVTLKGLGADVTVYRDKFAIPHIYAKNERDLYMAVGYVMAQDRLWQMDLLRRVTQGRLSEIFGDKLIEADVLFRSLRIRDNSEKLLAELTPGERQALEAFAEGVNRYIESRNGSLPPEFAILKYRPEKWEIIHSLNLIGYMAWDLACGWKEKIMLHRIREKVGEDLFRQIEADAAGDTPVVPGYARDVDGRFRDAVRRIAAASRAVSDAGLQVFSASNNWAVSGRLSATGAPLLANDMHLGYGMPCLWMQMHQVAEGSLDVTGVALPGQPLIIVGHNDKIAWGMTNLTVDNVDFYLEKTAEGDPARYLFRGRAIPFETRTERISVKGGPAVERKIRFTVHGPMVTDIKDTGGLAVSMKWMGSLKSNEFLAVYLLNRAGDWNSFKAALRNFVAVSQNFAYADRKGNIGMYCAGGVPVRMKTPGMDVAPGWGGEYEWKGTVPFEEMPNSYNPPRGFVSSANNLPAAKYRHYINGWGFASPERIDRINELIGSKGKITAEDFMKMQVDVTSSLTRKVRDTLVAELGAEKTLSDREKSILAVMAKWDGALAPDSASGALCDVFFLKMIRNTFEDELGGELFRDFISPRSIPVNALRKIWGTGSAWFDRVETKGARETFRDIVLMSFRDAIAELDEKCGSGGWAWGKLHRLRLEHPLGKVKALDIIFGLNSESYPVGGSFHTIPQFAYRFFEPYAVLHGPSQRHIYDLADWDRSLSAVPSGISGVPASVHYLDQAPLFMKGKYHEDVTSPGAVKERARYIMILGKGGE